MSTPITWQMVSEKLLYEHGVIKFDSEVGISLDPTFRAR